MAVAIITVNGVAGSNDSLPINTIISLSNQDAGGESCLFVTRTFIGRPSGYSIFRKPAAFNTVRNSDRSDSAFARPVSKILRFSERSDWAKTATVFALICFQFPTTIFRCVWTVVVNTLNCVFRRRAQPHISNEIFNRVEPSLANIDPTTAVVHKPLHATIRAATNHTFPCAPLNGRTQAVLGGNLLEVFSAKASATFRFSMRQSLRCYRTCISTIAQAIPLSRMIDFVSRTRLNYETVKTLSDANSHFYSVGVS